MSRLDRAAAPTTYDEVWVGRLGQLAEALDRRVQGRDPAAISASLLDLSSPRELWLGLYALTARMPDDAVVTELARRCEFEGVAPFFEAVVEGTTEASAAMTVELALDATLVDVFHTAASVIRTGIQRVARETAVRWHRDHDCVLVGWTADLDALRRLDASERAGLVDETIKPERSVATGVLVPLGGAYLNPELPADTRRTGRLLALARCSGLVTGVIGFDCVPFTTSEAAAPGLAAVFPRYLATLRHFDSVVTISEAAGAEYAGWRRMLGATGLQGPVVTTVSLPGESPGTGDTDAATAMFQVGSMPIVLVVGSHEPRKNHLAVLHAAERLWREGLRFSLSFVGGNSWGSDRFNRQVRHLQAAGRPVAALTKVNDRVLASSYTLARFTVFPSLNEGFGLPVAESLACGTPVITSSYGSMREIAEAGGALMVDPRDDDDLTRAMRDLLTDDGLLERLRAEARARPERSWDAYAAETWIALTASARS